MSTDASYNGEAKLDDVVRKAREDLDECDRLLCLADTKTNNWLRSLAGPLFDSMLQSGSDIMGFLTHPQAPIRRVCLFLMLDNWKDNSEFRESVRQLALKDPDPDVRRTAICFLGNCYRGSKDLTIGRLLAQVVSDDALRATDREAAYHSLCMIHEHTIASLRRRLKSRFPDDVDWTLVHNYRGMVETGDK